jgi:AcrR family transcriptional regulator
MTTSPASARKAGRPRRGEIDSAILQATVDELIERGFLAASMESIAQRAGIAKTTLYRRWPNTSELTLEAMRAFEPDNGQDPHGSVRDQIVWLVDVMRLKWGDPRYAAMMRRVAADGSVQPQMYRQARDRLIGPHVQRLNTVLMQGVDEGLIRGDIDIDWIRQLLIAPVMAAAMTLRGMLSRAQVEASVDTVLRGLDPRAAQ